MKGKYFTAPDFEDVEEPVIFLAGPIQGAEDWQSLAVQYIHKQKLDVNVASPRGDYSNRSFDYNTQVDWESTYLEKAAEKGVIIFWCAKEKVHDCGRSFAQTTRFELAKYVMKHHYEPKIQVVLGIEPGFSGERYIRKIVGEDCPDMEIYSTLEETCKAAVDNC